MKLNEIENEPEFSTLNVVATPEATPDSLGSLIMRTKLYRPPVGADAVRRDRLLKLLSDRRERLLTVIQASAGYGKSLLASSYAAGLDEPNAWVSLDDGDNDLRRFLCHVIAAVRSMFPESCRATLDLLKVLELPPLDILTHRVINDLDRLETDFMLFLDDYHSIANPAVHHLLGEMFRHPPRGLHVVLMTRTTPPLPLNAMRAKGAVNEITENRLRFTLEETALFLQNATAVIPDENDMELIDEKIEGWAVGLRLLALAVQDQGDLQVLLEKLQGDSTHIAEYLAAEVSARQTPAFKEALLMSSISNRFCASLCEALLDRTDSDTSMQLGTAPSGSDLIAHLKSNGMFLVPLDCETRWFRYHYMVRQLLQKQLEEYVGAKEIQRLHRVAGQWFAENNLIDEAISHLIAAGELESAVRLVESRRKDALTNDKWYSLKDWLEKLPDATIAVRPELLMARAWVYFHQFRLVEILPILDVVDALLKVGNPYSALRGEVDFFRAYFLFFSNRSEEAAAYFENALRLIPESYEHIRGEVVVNLGIARLMNGKSTAALVAEFQQILRDKHKAGDNFKSRIHAGLIYFSMLEGALHKALPFIEQLGAVGDRMESKYVQLWTTYLLGNVLLMMNDLKGAIRCFSHIYENRYELFTRVVVDAVSALALAYQLSFQPDKADETDVRLRSFVGHTETLENITLAQSCRARLSVLQGNVTSVADWADTVDLSSDTAYMIFFMESPRLTQCRVWIAARTASSLGRAEEALARHLEICKKTHNNYQVIQILTLQASTYFELGDQERARAAFAEAVSLGAPGGVILPFLEMGARALELLSSLKSDAPIAGWCEDLRAAIEALPNPFMLPRRSTPDGAVLERLNEKDSDAFSNIVSLHGDKRTESAPPPELRSSPPPAFQYAESAMDPSDEPLTARESEILTLLAEGLRNKEIAKRLFVSCETVKKHLYNMYQKFDVHSRGGLVAKFIEGNFPESTEKTV